MASATKNKLSSSTDGKAIKVAATATAGTAVHTAVSGSTLWDEIWIWAYNSAAGAIVLTIEFGGATAPDNNIVQTIPPGAGATIVVPGLILNNGATVKAFAGTTNVVTVMGYVNQITN